MENYETVQDLGAGSFGVTKLYKHKETKKYVAIKFIERGRRIDENVSREIINHRSLNHPNIIGFKEVVLTPTHLGMVMEYASGGELFEKIYNSGRFSENEAKFFFRQLIAGVEYCHSKQICHRDLKLDNMLLDGSKAERLKICDFGYSKSSVMHSKPQTNVGSATYAAPEVLSERQYDGKMADIWSCGVILYVMLVGAYPFEDKNDTRNYQKTIKRIMSAQYKIPDDLHLSLRCLQLLSRFFVQNPSRRISLKEIKRHPWFLKNNPREHLTRPTQATYYERNSSISLQSVEEIKKIVAEARHVPSSLVTIISFEWGIEEDEEEELEEDEEDDEDDEDDEGLEEDDEDDEDDEGLEEDEEDEEDENDKMVKEVYAKRKYLHI